MKFQIGYLGILISSIQYIPQAYKIWKTNDTHSFSTSTIIMYLIGQIIWVLHSLSINDIIRSIQSFINLFSVSFLLYKKFMNGEVFSNKTR